MKTFFKKHRIALAVCGGCMALSFSPQLLRAKETVKVITTFVPGNAKCSPSVGINAAMDLVQVGATNNIVEKTTDKIHQGVYDKSDFLNLSFTYRDVLRVGAETNTAGSPAGAVKSESKLKVGVHKELLAYVGDNFVNTEIEQSGVCLNQSKFNREEIVQAKFSQNLNGSTILQFKLPEVQGCRGSAEYIVELKKK